MAKHYKVKRSFNTYYDEEPVTYTMTCGEGESGTFKIDLQSSAQTKIETLYPNKTGSRAAVKLGSAPPDQSEKVKKVGDVWYVKGGIKKKRIVGVCTTTKTKAGKYLSSNVTTRDNNDTAADTHRMKVVNANKGDTAEFMGTSILHKQ